MASAYQIQIGMKEDGGFTMTPWNKAISIIRGQQCKIGAVLLDLSGVPITITGYVIRLKLPAASGPALVKTALPVNNNKGECEIELTSDDTALLAVGVKQNLEFEVTKSGNMKTFHPMKAVFDVVDQLIV